VPFTKREIEEGLQALLEELAESPEYIKFEVVGGAAVILQASRQTITSDIDALFAPTLSIEEAIRRVAQRNDWPEDWLNNAVVMFASHFDQPDDWEVRFSIRNVEILVARPPLLLAMKLLAGRGRRDYPDISLLLEICEVTTVDQAIEIFDQFYPTEVLSPRTLSYLASYFREHEQT
jgi:hypothetical protein